MRRAIVYTVACIIAAFTIIVGCSSSAPSGQLSSPAPSTQPVAETRVYDIRDLIHQVPDYQNAPDFNITMANKPQSLFGGETPDSELWVVARGNDRVYPGSDDVTDFATALASATQPFEGQGFIQAPTPKIPIPGSGALMAKLPKEQRTMLIPLKHTDVRASILGYISTVDVTQQYQNPYSEKIEAVYVFPLPQNAAVSDFLMTIGERKIRGIIREKAEAERIYNEAKRQGYVASLLTQQRPNIFTQSVANIEPGKRIDVNIKYFNTLQYVDGCYEFVFPMVVGPRFNPPGYKEGVGAIGRGDRAISGQMTEVQYLRPTERSGHDISLSVHIDAGVPIEKVESVNHRVTPKDSPTGADVTLASDDSIPNKDFVLRYKVAGDHPKVALITQRDARGGFFTLMVFPPDSLKDIPRAPLEMVFTLDVSGSMSGQPIAQAKNAIRYALTHMRADDTFQVIRFANNSEPMSQEPLPATRENVEAALRYIEQSDSGGGTMMLEGIRQSLNFPRDESRLRYVTFLTDGFIGNEVEIFREIRKSRGDSRIFSFGVGSSTNRYLLDGMARFGAGTAAYLSLSDDASKIMADYFERIAHPAMSDISIDFGQMQVSDVFPQKIPDLFVGRPVIITGRFTGAAPATIHVHARVGGKPQEIAVMTASSESSAKNALAAVWARAKISELSDSALDAPPDVARTNLPTQVKQVALEYGLMSAYTAFIAVDSSQVTAGDHGTSIAVPVPVPEGVKYETTVHEGAKETRHVE